MDEIVMLVVVVVLLIPYLLLPYLLVVYLIGKFLSLGSPKHKCELCGGESKPGMLICPGCCEHECSYEEIEDAVYPYTKRCCGCGETLYSPDPYECQ